MGLFRDSFDGFWESGRRARRVRAGITGRLMGAVVANGIALMLLSLAQSISAEGDFGAISVIFSLVIALAEMLVSAYFAAVVWAGANQGKLTSFDSCLLLRKLPLLIVGSAVIYVIQSFLSALCAMLSVLSVQAGVVFSLAVSLLITMANAGVAYGIVSGISGLAYLLTCTWTGLKRALSASGRQVVLFLIWSLVINVMFALLVTQNIVPVNGVTNVLHVLIIMNDWQLLVVAVALNLVNFAISGYFELDVLIEEALQFPNRNG